MNLHKDKYIIVEVIPTHSDNNKGFIAQISALKLDGIKLLDYLCRGPAPADPGYSKGRWRRQLFTYLSKI